MNQSSWWNHRGLKNSGDIYIGTQICRIRTPIIKEIIEHSFLIKVFTNKINLIVVPIVTKMHDFCKCHHNNSQPLWWNLISF